jgi:hypothetical protein
MGSRARRSFDGLSAMMLPLTQIVARQEMPVPPRIAHAA